MTIGGLRKRKGLKDDQHPVNLKLAMEITRRKARRLLDAAADFQSILAALLLLERLPNGRYPNRNPAQAAWLLPMVEAVRQTVITIATDREIDVVTTNSDGSPARRAFLLSRLGPGSVETILDPGSARPCLSISQLSRSWYRHTPAGQVEPRIHPEPRCRD